MSMSDTSRSREHRAGRDPNARKRHERLERVDRLLLGVGDDQLAQSSADQPERLLSADSQCTGANGMPPGRCPARRAARTPFSSSTIATSRSSTYVRIVLGEQRCLSSGPSGAMAASWNTARSGSGSNSIVGRGGGLVELGLVGQGPAHGLGAAGRVGRPSSGRSARPVPRPSATGTDRRAASDMMRRRRVPRTVMTSARRVVRPLRRCAAWCPTSNRVSPPPTSWPRSMRTMPNRRSPSSAIDGAARGTRGSKTCSGSRRYGKQHTAQREHRRAAIRHPAARPRRQRPGAPDRRSSG